MGEKIDMTTTSQKVANDVKALLRARNPLIWVVTREEARVEGYLFEAAAAAGYLPKTWDIAQGVTGMDGKAVSGMTARGPDEVLSLIAEKSAADLDRRGERGAWILRDLTEWIGNGMAGATLLRQLRNLTRTLPASPRGSAQAVIVITPSRNIPPEISAHATVIDWPLPDREEVAAIFDATIGNIPEFEADDPTKPFRSVVVSTSPRAPAVDAAIGLSGLEIQACFAKSLVQLRRIDPAAVAQEKRRVVSREGVLEWFDPLPGGLDAVGGLENLKAWLVSRAQAYTPEAREYGLPPPKGTLLAGIPGCGKSLTAKAIATAWNIPLIRIDFGAMKSKFVGDSEQTLRKAFAVIGAIGRCVVWADELEKALQGATSGSADGGVSADALGAFLSWMQDRQGEAFVVATANDVESLPPELLRKGRFDEVWFVDLPNQAERLQILVAALLSRGRTEITEQSYLLKVAIQTDGFTGSEVAELVPDAMFRAFADGQRPLEVADLLAAVDTVVPLSKTADDKIKKLREWAKGRARPANTAQKDQRSKGKTGTPDLDM
jgi:hypothetical protein